MAESGLLDMLIDAGAIVDDYRGMRVARHFGDPAHEYAAATETMAVVDRSHRTRLRVSGRAPGQMLDGILTGRIPDSPAHPDDGPVQGVATYHCVLTPKGKMVTDLWAFRLGDEDGPGFLLDVPVAGRDGLRAHLEKFLPPRFAELEDISAETASLSVVGPLGAEALSRDALGLHVEADNLRHAQEGTWWSVGEPADGLLVVRTADVWPEAFTVYGSVSDVIALWKRLVAAGARPAGLGVWSTLRVEAGRPVYGTDMDDSTIPVEAGIHERAIDYQKGCYTGQEVIVRIRDRGHVNRHLRLLELGDVPTPAAGTELRSADDPAKPVGWITSAVQSPKAGGVLALAYVRRETQTVLLDGRTVSVPQEPAGG